MIARLSLLFYLTMFLHACFGQDTTFVQTTRYSSKDNYTDFVISDGRIWALTTTKMLRIFDLASGDRIDTVKAIDSPILAIAKDRNNHVVVAYKDWLLRYDLEKKVVTLLSRSKMTMQGIVFNRSNHPFLIAKEGIEDLTIHKVYFSNIGINRQIHYPKGWSRKPVYHLDDNDNIWIGFGYGEWGGDLFIFNTISHKFTIPHLRNYPIELNPVKSIFSIDTTVYVTAGLDHMLTSGSIARFDFYRDSVILNNGLKREKDGAIKEGEYIGPACFNAADHCIYFYSQHGIFKGNPTDDLSTMDKWERIAKPVLHWSNGQPDAVGSPMNVLKMEFADPETLVFVTQLDGIGILKNNRLTLVR